MEEIKEMSSEAISTIQVRDDDDSDHDGSSSRGGEKKLDLGYILKLVPTRLVADWMWV